MERPFTIHYSDRVVHGKTQEDWVNAPSDDVQVVVEWRLPVHALGEWKYAGVTDRVLWTGEDTYDPFGWGVKYGRWMYDYDYHQLWEVAAHGR